MLPTFQVVVLVLVALTMACAVGHALELPGKLRLSKETYFAVQPIYYPGFTVVGGVAEILGTLGAFALLPFTPRGNMAFPLTLATALAMLLAQAIFWVFTQPVNRIWLRGQTLGAAGTAFFRVGAAGRAESDWTALRNRWEYSHLARAILSLTALVLLASGIAAT